MLTGGPIYLRRLELQDAPRILDVRVQNRLFLEPFEPFRSPDFYTLGVQQQQIQVAIDQWKHDEAYAFGIFLKSDGLVGRVALSNIVRGAWQNATLGYFVAEAQNGKGIATEAVRLALQFGFTEARLHRVQAGIMPRNRASGRVLEKNGFRYEGESPRYLNINGVWEDHSLFAITVEEWPPANH